MGPQESSVLDGQGVMQRPGVRSAGSAGRGGGGRRDRVPGLPHRRRLQRQQPGAGPRRLDLGPRRRRPPDRQLPRGKHRCQVRPRALHRDRSQGPGVGPAGPRCGKACLSGTESQKVDRLALSVLILQQQSLPQHNQ